MSTQEILRPIRVLIVEDERLISSTLRRGFVRRGHMATEAASATDGLRALASAPSAFDAVLLDLRLPDRRDLGLLASVRLMAPAAAVLLMTAFADQPTRAEAIALGARTVIDKPFDVASVVTLVESEVSY